MKKILAQLTLAATLCFGLTTTLFAQTQNPTPNTNAAGTTAFTPEQTQAIEQIVHRYLIAHPEVLIEVSQVLEKQSEAKQEQSAVKAVQSNLDALFNDKQNPVVGNAAAPVTLVEFFDYQCGHCKQMNQIVAKVAKDNPQVRVVFKELPIFGDSSQIAAQAALAAAKQNKYFELHNALLAADNPLTEEKIYNIARSVGLNVEQLKKDMKDPAILNQIKSNFKLAQSLQIAGTPTFVIGNVTKKIFRFVPGATSEDNLKNLIEQAS